MTPAAFLAALLLATPPAPKAEAPRARDGFAITISGGASLGAYEAGITWALVRSVRQGEEAAAAGSPTPPGLVATAGTSAGALNAFLAAALWCERGGTAGGTVDDNLLLDAWRGLDLTGLLPEDARRYRPSDGLLSAAPLEKAGERVQSRTLDAPPGRYVPGCRAPVGIVVTQATPEQREAAGLRTPAQRFALTWALEVGADGRMRVVRQALAPGRAGADAVLDLAAPPAGPAAPATLAPAAVLQGMLASGAIPLAFAPRPLCSCSARCPAGAEAEPWQCPGGSAGLSCAGAAAPGGAVARLCRRDYVDGGVFDNVPVGLTVDLVEATRTPSPLRPVWYVLVDPDQRRFPPARDLDREVPGRTPVLSEQVQLFGRLIGTARASELSHAVRGDGWNRTTRRILRDAAEAFSGFAEVHAALAQAAAAEGAAAPEPPGGTSAPEPLSRAAYQRRLASCLAALAASRPRASAPLDPCAETLLATPLAPAGALADRPQPGEVLALARQLAAAVRMRSAVAELSVKDILASQPAALAHLRLATVATLFLADEVDLLASSLAPEDRLREFQEAVLAPVRAAPALGRLTAKLAGAVLDARLALIARAGPEPVAAEAARLRRALAALPAGAVFGQASLGALPARMASALVSDPADPGHLASHWQSLDALLLARGRLRRLQERTASLVEDADRLAEADGSERALVITTRFAPLAGEHLSAFAGFLDEPLRLHDWYAGVYEGARAVAEEMCERQDADEPGRAQPARRAGTPSLLDLEAPETQRCLGSALRDVVGGLGLDRSRRARHVVATLAGMELAAWLGEAPARLLREEPSWSWLGALEASDPRDPVDAVLHALTARRAPCRPSDRDLLCPGELHFDELLAGLRAAGYRAASPEMRLALEQPDLFWATLARRLSDRALAIEMERERATGAPSPPWVRTGLGAALLLTRGEAQRGPAPRFQLDTSTVPGGTGPGRGAWRLALAHFVPYRLALDVGRGGVGISWLEPALRISPSFSLESTFEPVVLEGSAGRWSSVLGLLPTFRARGVSFGAGPLWSVRWRGGSAVGVEARLATFQDRAGVAFGLRDVGGPRPGDSWFLSIFVADLNGLVWWLTPLGGGG